MLGIHSQKAFRPTATDRAGPPKLEITNATSAASVWRETTDQARTNRDRILKQMREILSNRTYVKNIVNDLASTIG